MSNLYGTVDGLPASYDVKFIIETNKKCYICEKNILKKHINNKEVIYLDDIEFCHKKCLEDNRIEYEHIKKSDKTTPAQITKIEKEKKSKHIKINKEDIWFKKTKQIFDYKFDEEQVILTAQQISEDNSNVFFQVQIKTCKKELIVSEEYKITKRKLENTRDIKDIIIDLYKKIIRTQRED